MNQEQSRIFYSLNLENNIYFLNFRIFIISIFMKKENINIVFIV